jgi:vacuolar-type H+-ATPase subunit F/Vma7
MMKPSQMIVIGERDTVFGLSLLGFQGMVVTDQQEALKALQEASREPGVALILLTETFAELAKELEQKERSAEGPLIIPIPSSQGVKPRGSLREQVQRVLRISLKE